MDNETLKKFCGLPSEEMIFRENRTWLLLYSTTEKTRLRKQTKLLFTDFK